MVAISLQTDFDRFARSLHDLRLKQLPYAAMRALNDTAQEARQEITRQLPAIFDRPTVFTANSIAVLAASKTNLRATVLVKDQQSKYLTLEETGGTRTAAMNTRKPGVALTLPGVGAKLDAYGNLPSGFIARLRRKLQAQKEAPKKRRRGKSPQRDTGIVYFAGKGPHGQGPGGYFQRTSGHHLTRLTGFEATETYRPIFHFRHRVELIARRSFRVYLMRRLREAIATAR